MDSPPRQSHAPNNRTTAASLAEFVDQTIEELLSTRAILECPAKPDVVSPLSVAQGKKLRLIFDLSWLNQFVVKESIKFEDISKAWDMLRSSRFLCAFDLKSGYHHVSVHPEFRKFFGFCWRNKFYTFNVLPFGFAPAPYIFTKIFKPLLANWRKNGINICLYIDDGIICGNSYEEVS
ncbi:hypothetical protein ANCCAN_08312 [Ancylostoma caninum]|uniref:Reverse transcriptase domain-containing protein n=1 Tax=Ancylostoma caninum TaxID=29170 RepID=A0A368GRL6_ANCCA|nr:hypothetical protein ANCCAN_08312 [Ancylostoma caninum]